MAGFTSQLEPGLGPQAGLWGVLGGWAAGWMSDTTEPLSRQAWEGGKVGLRGFGQTGLGQGESWGCLWAWPGERPGCRVGELFESVSKELCELGLELSQLERVQARLRLARLPKGSAAGTRGALSPDQTAEGQVVTHRDLSCGEMTGS